MSNVETLAHNWSFAVFLLGVAGMCLFMLGASYFLGGRQWGRAKEEPFESGIVGQGDAHLRMSVKFYMVAMLFVIFDVEALFLYAWAVSAREVYWPGFIGVTVFSVILLIGLFYEYRMGGLDWSPAGRRRKAARLAHGSGPQSTGKEA